MNETPAHPDGQDLQGRRGFFKLIWRLATGALLVAGSSRYALSLADENQSVPALTKLDADDLERLRSKGEILAGDFVVRGAPSKVIAIDLKCPHLGCEVIYDPKGGEFRCPCHRSRFDSRGKYLEGPAGKDLARGVVRGDESGMIISKSDS